MHTTKPAEPQDTAIETVAGDVAIRVRELVKTFGDTRALDGVELTVPHGGILGLLGPNGAGKTTLIRVLSTLSRPDAGTAEVLGHDVVSEPDQVRRAISVAGQFASLDDVLTGSENLVLHGRLLGLARTAARERAEELLDAFGLAAAGGRAVRTYSGGMRRRLDLALCVTTPPRLLFLDEPTTGLDPPSRFQVWQTVRRLVDQGTTVLLTTQYLEEADQLCDRIAVVDQGRVIADDTPDRLKAAAGSGVLRLRTFDPDSRRAATVALRTLPHLAIEATDSHGLVLRPDADSAPTDGRRPEVSELGDLVAAVLHRLGHEGIHLASVSWGSPSLDEVFLSLTGHTTHDPDGTHDSGAGDTGGTHSTEDVA